MKIVYGKHVNRFPPKTVRLFLAYNQFLVRSKIVKWKPDVVHETYYTRFGSAPKFCPTVITVYDMIHELFSDEMPLTDSTSALKRIAVDRADAVICISENTKQDLIRLYGTPASKISVVHLGFDQFSSQESLSLISDFQSLHFYFMWDRGLAIKILLGYHFCLKKFL